MKKEAITKSGEYQIWAADIIGKIKQAQIRTSSKVNAEMLQLYFEIGTSILEQQETKGLGSKIVEQLSFNLQHNFPHSFELSVRSLKYMRSFAEAHPQYPIVQVQLAQTQNEMMQVPLAQITWYYHISFLSTIKDISVWAFYIIETARNEWSRDIMLLQIENKLYERSGKAFNNFESTLPDYESDLVTNLSKKALSLWN